MESEIFGHEKGAFTGAAGVRQGCFELAHEGTLFLDEIAEMPVELQPKLLRVLEDGRVRRLGGKKEFRFDTRVIAATNRDPAEAIEAGNESRCARRGPWPLSRRRNMISRTISGARTL
jgi:transcriptional regulator with GAF, ATPase, and Fis domain